MLRVVETFSGIGAQAKALRNIGVEHEIVATADWDINAIVAYDIIHHGPQDLSKYDNLTKADLESALEKFTLSPDGKTPYPERKISHLSILALKSILCAIERSNNLVSITDMTYKDIPADLDLFTYSFPCQDLSIAGVWHGNMSGIDRDAKNRSGMLWEVERILKECVAHNSQLPTFLLMENVSNILAPRHMGNFTQWINYLSEIGYYNKIYKLNAKNFGVPQTRTRAYMISIFIGNNENLRNQLNDYFDTHDLENNAYVETLNLPQLTMADIVKVDYLEPKYRNEANISQITDTTSRRKIIEENDHIYSEQTGEYIEFIKTITTKQDRNPNSGVIEYNNCVQGKANYRYLTSRECFLAMGFDEADYDALIDNNILLANNRPIFSDGKLIKMAGNSIVVNVLEAIFIQICDIKEHILND